MRLIDADKLIEAIENIKLYNVTPGQPTFDMNRVRADELLETIKNQPTAYDVDKVVAELEQEKEYSYANFTEYVNEYSPCLDDEYDDLFHRGLERAMKIVKAGGVG